MGGFRWNGKIRGPIYVKRRGARTALGKTERHPDRACRQLWSVSSNKALRKCFQYIKISKTGLFAVREPVAYVLIKSHTVKTIVEHPVYPVVIIICAERDFFH